MRVFGSIDEASGSAGLAPGAALAIGNFDGVHLGHRALLAEALRLARAQGTPAAALTFEPHPGKVLGPKVAPRLLTTPARKLELLAEAGLDAVVVQPFDAAFAAVSAEAFVQGLLLGGLRVGAVVVGEDFSFGQGRRGRAEQLRAWLPAGGARLSLVPKVELDGAPVSSTRVRELVLEGRVAQAARMLARPFDVDGRVVTGMGRGRGLGFPTANVLPDAELLPANGVYAVRARGTFGELPGAANLGRKPTFGEDAGQTLEIHLIGFAGKESLVGQPMRVAFLERLRDEQRFPSVEALAVQIGRDVALAARIGNAPGR